MVKQYMMVLSLESRMEFLVNGMPAATRQAKFLAGFPVSIRTSSVALSLTAVTSVIILYQINARCLSVFDHLLHASQYITH
jgi:hypothetical protein